MIAIIWTCKQNGQKNEKNIRIKIKGKRPLSDPQEDGYPRRCQEDKKTSRLLCLAKWRFYHMKEEQKHNVI
jgi:hypothetical protein